MMGTSSIISRFFALEGAPILAFCFGLNKYVVSAVKRLRDSCDDRIMEVLPISSFINAAVEQTLCQ